MTVTKHLAGITAAFLLTLGGSQAAHAEPLRIGHGIWVGYGPFFVAQEKGFFADEGVEVDTIHMAFGGEEWLLDGQIDALTSTVDTPILNSGPNSEPMVCLFALDDSLGGDGIVASNDIHSIADLKGKSVAFQELAASEFYLNVLLQEAGLSVADIEPVALSVQDAAEAFMLQEVDAAVIWEPHLTLAKNAKHGHLLTDSSKHPGLIVDCLLTMADVFAARKAEFQALGRAWASAVDYVAAHPDEAIEIMARSVGGWLEDPAEFAETLKGIRFYDAGRNREYFGTPENPGQVYDTVQKAIDVWSSLGLLEVDRTPADVIRHGVWDE